MDLSAAAAFTGYAGDDLTAFVSGVLDGEWLSLMDRRCWPEDHVCAWNPYEDGRMHGYFDGIRPVRSTIPRVEDFDVAEIVAA